jgi:hypothetical protein
MEHPLTLETERVNNALRLFKQLLPPISDAPSREAVHTALADGRAEVLRQVRAGCMDIYYGSSLGALLETSADERLRELPAPGGLKLVGLFGGRNA